MIGRCAAGINQHAVLLEGQPTGDSLDAAEREPSAPADITFSTATVGAYADALYWRSGHPEADRHDTRTSHTTELTVPAVLILTSRTVVRFIPFAGRHRQSITACICSLRNGSLPTMPSSTAGRDKHEG